jgi:hypothetical protein
MGRRRYALERGGPKRLELRWRRGLRDFEVVLDGNAWRVVDREALDAGATLTPPDGSSLRVQRVRRRWWSIALRNELLVERDGVAVPGSDGDPRVIARGAASLVGLFGVLNLGFAGLFSLFTRSGNGLGFALEGLVLCVLAVLAALGRRLPIALAAGFLAVDTLLPVLALGMTPNPLGLAIRALVVVHLYRAWRRMRPVVRPAGVAAVFE